MSISLQSNLPPGYIPPGVDPKSLDPATRKMVETTGITLEAALKLIGVEVNDTNAGRLESLLDSMLPKPSGDKPMSDPFGGLSSESVSIDIYSVMALFQKCAQEMRNQAREVRNSEMQNQVSSLKNAAQEIRNAAEDRMQQAIISGAFQITGGLVSVGMGVTGGVLGAKGINAGADTVSGMKLSNVASTLSNSAQGAGSIFTGIGGMVGSSKEREAAEHDAKKSELESDAKVHEQSVQQANDLMQQMMDVIRDVREKLGAIDQARNETNRGIARNV
ncbi:type III secretion system translocon subunit SctB [Castellaniella sp.]|uniref:type III secretion system translocon subunit SctB n=1 Tax=Castellaniella sp. TaxID=1955812 RepID=UPI002AFF81B6|nr:type III secretion system translocon subunit SctB [Castellaniella sp.]